MNIMTRERERKSRIELVLTSMSNTMIYLGLYTKYLNIVMADYKADLVKD